MADEIQKEQNDLGGTPGSATQTVDADLQSNGSLASGQGVQSVQPAADPLNDAVLSAQKRYADDRREAELRNAALHHAINHARGTHGASELVEMADRFYKWLNGEVKAAL